jgi:hypothetical protein
VLAADMIVCDFGPVHLPPPFTTLVVLFLALRCLSFSALNFAWKAM